MQLKTKFKRATSAFMALVLTLGLLPSGIIQASAADDMPDKIAAGKSNQGRCFHNADGAKNGQLSFRL